jgi:hypothetical protein
MIRPGVRHTGCLLRACMRADRYSAYLRTRACADVLVPSLETCGVVTSREQSECAGPHVSMPTLMHHQVTGQHAHARTGADACAFDRGGRVRRSSMRVSGTPA